MENILYNNENFNLVSVKQLSQLIDIPEYTLCEYIREKRFPAYRFGKRYFFDLREIEKTIKQNPTINS